MSLERGVWRALLHVVFAMWLVGCFQVPPEPQWAEADVPDVLGDSDQVDGTSSEESGSEDAGEIPCVGKDCPPDVCTGPDCADALDPSDADTNPPPDVCEPECVDKDCGPDGCGGSCGDCATGESCGGAGLCECQPACVDKDCGPDGCGGSCGDCATGESCGGAGLCECQPDCVGKACGDDGCEGSCGECAQDTEVCTLATQQCVCANAQCGDGCCEPDQTCHVDQDICCDPSCLDAVCGLNACGESCGECESNAICDSGECICVPDCNGKECGLDGCAGFCGVCAADEICGDTGLCECEHVTCVDACCSEGDVCHAGSCCTPDCTDKVCGEGDGCGGLCTACPNAEVLAFQCLELICPVDSIEAELSTPCVVGGSKANGSECEDGNACTLGDACFGGSCLPGDECPGDEPCASQVCHEGQCATSFSTPGEPCDDGDACTEGDVCVSPTSGSLTICQGDEVSCNDENSCTIDTCGPAGCEYVPLSDGTECSEVGVCIQGACCEDICSISNSCGFSSCGLGCGLCIDAGKSCVANSCVDAAAPEGMQAVQAGLGLLGCDVGGSSCDSALQGADESPEVLVYLSAYAIDTFEVTIHDFNAFLNSLGGPAEICGDSEFGPCIALDGSAWSALVSQGAQYPASHVTWMGASDYCTSKSKRLCTEAEWERAARHDAGVWPWGASPEPGFACTHASHGGLCGDGPSVVGSHPAGISSVQAHDMAGNVAEWTADFHADDIYQLYVADSPITYQPQGPGVGTGTHVIRGGSFASPKSKLTITSRSFAPSDLSGIPNTSAGPDELGTDAIGFRCCVDL